MVYNSLVRVLNEIDNPQISLKEIKDKFEEFESVISKVGDCPNQLESDKILEILLKIGERSGYFYKGWKKEAKITLTNEELEYLDEILAKASNWFRGLAKTSTKIRAEESDIQKGISESRADIAEEKKKRQPQQSPPNNTPNSTEKAKKLRAIVEKFGDSEISLLETKSSYEELINIIDSHSPISAEEAILGLEVIRKITGRIIIFYTEWKNTKKIQPSKEELNLLEEISNRISNAYIGMMKTDNSQSLVEEEKYIQDKVQQIKTAISEERNKNQQEQKNKDDKKEIQKQISDLETSIKVLENSNKGSNDNKTKEEIDKLKSQLQDLNDRLKNKDPIPKEERRNPKESEWKGFGKNALLAIGVIIGILLIIWLIKKTKS
jgi:hypothetical protein